MMTLTQNLVELSDFAWQRLRMRVEGLTDEEYLWEPVPGCWTVRVTADGPKRDWVRIPPDPAPFTTLAWRIAHLVELLQEERTATWFGHQPAADDGVPAVPVTADEAIEALDHAYAVWRRRLAALSADDLTRSLGAIAGMYAEQDGTAFALHILDELIHHGAEVGTVRDFYRGLQPEDPAVGALLRGERPEASEIERVRTARPALVAEAAAAHKWTAVPLLLELGFDVDARNHAGLTAAHLAAGKGEVETLRVLVEAGADVSVRDPRFDADVLGWAEWFEQSAAAEYLAKAAT